jgi:hypothetical protein
MGFFEFLWLMVIFFFWIMAISIFFRCLMDIFSRRDLAGGTKAVWLIVLFVLPFLGCLIYLLKRPAVTAQDVEVLARADAAQKAAANVSTADELMKLAELRDRGVISVPEYDSLKANLVA